MKRGATPALARLEQRLAVYLRYVQERIALTMHGASHACVHGYGADNPTNRCVGGRSRAGGTGRCS
jgi:hypothetical protein